MAANAGYPAAKIEYAKLMKDYPELIRVLEENPRYDDPSWNYELSVYYRVGGEKNTLRDAGKALEYLKNAAELNHITAIATLEKAYRQGSKQLNVQANQEIADQYAQKLQDIDIKMERTDFFQSLIEKAKQGDMSSMLHLLRRAEPHSSFAAYQLAQLYKNGNAELQIGKDPLKAFVFLHLAVQPPTAKAALSELSEYYTVTSQVFTPSEDFVKVYRTLLNSYK